MDESSVLIWVWCSTSAGRQIELRINKLHFLEWVSNNYKLDSHDMLVYYLSDYLNEEMRSYFYLEWEEAEEAYIWEDAKEELKLIEEFEQALIIAKYNL